MAEYQMTFNDIINKTHSGAIHPLRVLDLFAGIKSISNAFADRGHEVYTIDWDKTLDGIDLYADINTVTAEQILETFGHPDIIWASPDCTSYSVAGIHHHRRRDKTTGELVPISEYARFCDMTNQYTLDLIQKLQPSLYFIENPRGGMRTMSWMKNLPRYTVTYCKYETDRPVSERRMKPTDIWTNHPCPQFMPACKNGDPCHAPAPRGARTGTQGIMGARMRSAIPRLLCEHIVDICEDYMEANHG